MRILKYITIKIEPIYYTPFPNVFIMLEITVHFKVGPKRYLTGGI